MRVRISTGLMRCVLIATVAGAMSGACALDKQDEPALVGPSETGVSVQLTALPDTINADGVSTVQVELKVRANSGEALSGLAVLFQLQAGDGEMKQHPNFTYVGPVQEGFVMATDSSGTARVIYVAGTAVGTTATIEVRPYGIDGNKLFSPRKVDILQR